MAIKGSVAWINYLDKIELPVLSNTLKSICLVTESDKVKIEELVKVILNDADLTSKVLKLANSVCYNPQQFSISTMSRAIVQIGFESIKAIAISSALVDQLSQKNNQKQLFHSLVRSFHAAVQAKYMASDYYLEEQETSFLVL
jgi:HD-like signal output (HDOD) protein